MLALVDFGCDELPVLLFLVHLSHLAREIC
jgi:hypothetical protein